MAAEGRGALAGLGAPVLGGAVVVGGEEVVGGEGSGSRALLLFELGPLGRERRELRVLGLLPLEVVDRPALAPSAGDRRGQRLALAGLLCCNTAQDRGAQARRVDGRQGGAVLTSRSPPFQHCVLVPPRVAG